MNREDIIRMGYAVAGPNKWWQDDSDLEEFAALVAAHEREQCARVCDDFESNNKWSDAHGYDHVFAAAIRARGEK